MPDVFPWKGGGVLVLKFLFDPCIISKKRETCFPRVRQRKEFDLTYMEVMEMLIDIGFSEPKHVDGESKLIDVLFIRPWENIYVGLWKWPFAKLNNFDGIGADLSFENLRIFGDYYVLFALCTICHWIDMSAVEEWNIHCRILKLSSKSQIWYFILMLSGGWEINVVKCMPRVQHDYFSSLDLSS